MNLYYNYFAGGSALFAPTDADVINFLAQVTTLNNFTKLQLQRLIAGLKSDGVYTKLEHLYLNLGTSITDMAIDFVTLTSDTAINSPVYNSTYLGTEYDGSASCFRTALTPATCAKLTATSASAGVFFSTAFGFPTNACLLGADNGSTTNMMIVASGT